MCFTRSSSEAIAPMCGLSWMYVLSPASYKTKSQAEAIASLKTHWFLVGSVMHCMGRFIYIPSSPVMAAQICPCGWAVSGLKPVTSNGSLTLLWEISDWLVAGRCQQCCWHYLTPCFIIFLPYSDLLLTDPPST